MEFRKSLAALCCACFLVMTGCEKKPVERKIAHDFESLMGKELAAWKHVQTPEDFHNLSFFKEVYEQNIAYLQHLPTHMKIPKVIHFIWVGPKAFPFESVENVRTWIAHHPDWKIKFWSDRKRVLPHPSMELCLIETLSPFRLKALYRRSDNYAEKSDLLRLEILYNEGGVYADHDIKCFKSFDSLNRAYDFYCGMEVPYPTSLSSSVLPTNNILGARPGHPLIPRCMEWLEENWEGIEEAYPGRDRDATINRIAHRTFFVLGSMFKEYANVEGNIDIALPSYYFNAPKEEWAIFAQHQYRGTWFENESAFEKMARKRLMMLSKKTNKLLLAVAVLGGLNLLGFLLLLLLLRRRRLSH